VFSRSHAARTARPDFYVNIGPLFGLRSSVSPLRDVPFGAVTPLCAIVYRRAAMFSDVPWRFAARYHPVRLCNAAQSGPILCDIAAQFRAITRHQAVSSCAAQLGAAAIGDELSNHVSPCRSVTSSSAMPLYLVAYSLIQPLRPVELDKCCVRPLSSVTLHQAAVLSDIP